MSDRAKKYAAIWQRWSQWCHGRSLHPSKSLRSNKSVADFLSEVTESTRAQYRSALRAKAFELGINPKEVGGSIVLRRPPRVITETLGEEQRSKIEAMIWSRSRPPTMKAVILALFASGVTPARMATLQVRDLAPRKEIDGISYLCDPGRRGSIFMIRGVCAEAISRWIDACPVTNGPLVVLRRNRPVCRQTVYKTLDSMGVFDIRGANTKNVFGCLKEEAKHMSKEEDSANEADKIRESIRKKIGKTRVYDPESGKMKLLLPDGKYIEANMTEEFAREIEKSGEPKPKVEKKTVVECVASAVGQVVPERMESIMKGANGYATLADIDKNQAINVMAAALSASIKSLEENPDNIVQVSDTAMSIFIVYRAMIIAGVEDP